LNLKVTYKHRLLFTGLHSYNKLYIKLGTGYPTSKNAKLLRLELFDISSLKDFAKEGRTLVASSSAEDASWTIEAYFTIEKGTAKGNY
jgi:hypothetical protein